MTARNTTPPKGFVLREEGETIQTEDQYLNSSGHWVAVHESVVGLTLQPGAAGVFAKPKRKPNPAIVRSLLNDALSKAGLSNGVVRQTDDEGWQIELADIDYRRGVGLGYFYGTVSGNADDLLRLINLIKVGKDYSDG